MRASPFQPPTPGSTSPPDSPHEASAFVALSEPESPDQSTTFSLEQALDSIGVGRFQIKLVLICGCWWAADAMEVMLLSFLLPTVETEWGLRGWQTALVAACTFIGILMGSFAWGVVADKLGRRKGYLATALFTSIFGLASCFAGDFVSLLILRGILGFGVGGSPVAFSLLSEWVPKRNRGTFLTFFEVFWTVGTVAEVFLAWAVLPRLGWRWLLGFSSVPLWLLLLCYPFLPESPRFLLITDEYEKTVQVLQDAATANRSSLPPGSLDREFKKDEGRGRVLELLSPGVRQLSILIWILWIAHAVIYYGNVLFTPKFFGSHHQTPTNGSLALGTAESSTSTFSVSNFPLSFSHNHHSLIYDHNSANSLTQSLSNDMADNSTTNNSEESSWLNLYVFVLLTTLAELPGLFGAAFLVERLGRKKTMASLLLVCLVALFGLFFNPPGWGGMILLAISRMGINGSIATLWTFTPEAYPTTLRATGLGVANALSKVATTGTPFISTALSDDNLYIAVIVFGLCCIGGIAAALFLPFDTTDSILPSTLGALIVQHKQPQHQADHDENNQFELDVTSYDEEEGQADS